MIGAHVREVSGGRQQWQVPKKQLKEGAAEIS